MQSNKLVFWLRALVLTAVALTAASCGSKSVHESARVEQAEMSSTVADAVANGPAASGATAGPSSTLTGSAGPTVETTPNGGATAPNDASPAIKSGTPPPLLQSALPPGVVAEVDKLVGAPSLADARRATEGILTGAGIGLLGDAAGASPAGGLRISPTQVDAVARDARLRAGGGRTTLSEFVDTLQKAGAPLPSTSPADLAFVDFLAEWMQAALAAPDDPHSAPLLYLAALAERQNPPVDLAAGDYNPQELRLGFLDLNLLASALAQLAPGFGLQAPASGAAAAGPVARVWGDLHHALFPTAYAADANTPCSKLKDDLKSTVPLGGFGGEAGSIAAGQVASKVIETGVESYTKYMVDDPSAAAAAFGKMLNQLGILMKIQALLELYGHSSAEAQVLSGNPIHQPGEHDGKLLSAVKVSAGVPDDEWNAFKADAHQNLDPLLDAFKDCANFAGLPVLTGVGDIAGQVKNWLVHWSIEGGEGIVEFADPTHMDFPGSIRNYLKPEGDHKGVDTLPVRILPERDEDHPGDLVHVPVTIMAEVATDQPPSLGDFLGMAMAGPAGLPLALAAAVTDIMAGWWQSLDTLDASVVLDVTHHVLREGQWHGVIEVRTWLEASSTQIQQVDHHSADPVVGTPLGSDTIDFTRERRTRHDRLVIRGVAKENGSSGAVLVASDSVQAAYAYQHLYDQRATTQLNLGPCAVTEIDREYTAGQGGGSGEDVVVEVVFSVAGGYARAQGPLPVAKFSILAQSHTETRAEGGRYCLRQNPTDSDDHEAWSTEQVASGPLAFGLTTDPKAPNHWQGTQRVAHADLDGHVNGATVYHWDLWRDAPPAPAH